MIKKEGETEKKKEDKGIAYMCIFIQKLFPFFVVVIFVRCRLCAISELYLFQIKQL